jgi:chromosome segregation ATPase
MTMMAYVLCSLVGVLAGGGLATYVVTRTQSTRAKEAEGKLRAANAVEIAVLQSRLDVETRRADEVEGKLRAAELRASNVDGELKAETKRADDAARELTGARSRIEQLIQEVASVESDSEAETERANLADCLLAELRAKYDLAENAARHHTGRHAYHKTMSEKREARIKLLHAHILDLDARWREAESRAARNAVIVRLVELAKLIIRGDPLPPLPGKG